MEPIIALSVIAGTASLASGVATAILSAGRKTRNAPPPLPKTAWQEPDQIVNGIALNIHDFANYTKEAIRRLWAVLAVGILYFVISATALLFSQTGVGSISQRLIYLLALVSSVVAGVFVASLAITAYRIVRNQQREIEQKTEQVREEVRRLTARGAL